jgi:hypothetical protein
MCGNIPGPAMVVQDGRCGPCPPGLTSLPPRNTGSAGAAFAPLAERRPPRRPPPPRHASTGATHVRSAGTSQTLRWLYKTVGAVRVPRASPHCHRGTPVRPEPRLRHSPRGDRRADPHLPVTLRRDGVFLFQARGTGKTSTGKHWTVLVGPIHLHMSRRTSGPTWSEHLMRRPQVPGIGSAQADLVEA